MTRIRIAAVTAASAALVVTTLGTAAATAGTTGRATLVPFSATYAGKASVKVTDDVADITAAGSGTATVIGASKVSGRGSGDTSVQPCVPFTGKGSIAAANGSSRLDFAVVPGSSGCGDEGGKVFSIVGRAKVSGGTGLLAKASGTLKITGLYDRVAGTFSIKFSGKLTTGGSATVKKTALKISADARNRLAFTRKALTARAGRITIAMKNPSSLSHNVAVRKGVGSKSRIIARGKIVKKGGVSTVSVTLKKGKYRFACTVRGHEAAGMWGILTVR